MGIEVGALVAEKYRIKGLLGRGGMGSVFHAVQEPLGRNVAIKTLTIQDLTPAERTYRETRFFREAAICAQLSHPNTVIIYDYGELPNKELFLVMEYLEGKSLRQLERETRRLPVDLTLQIASQIAASLADAHDHGIIHRDLKPPNIMLVPRGTNPYFVKVVDFGLVKDLENRHNEPELTTENSIVGSPMYMAPERFLSKEFDAPAVDIYALGIMMYEMLCGRPPFQLTPGTTIHQLVLDHVEKDPPKMRDLAPDIVIPARLEALIMACLEKVPARRPGSMAAIQYQLSRALDAPASPSLPHAVTTVAAIDPLDDAKTIEASTADLAPRTPALPERPAANRGIPRPIIVLVPLLLLLGLTAVFAAASTQRTAAPPPRPVASPKPPEPVAYQAPTTEPKPKQPTTLAEIMDNFVGLKLRVLCKLGEELDLPTKTTAESTNPTIVSATGASVTAGAKVTCLAVGDADVRAGSTTYEFRVGAEETDVTIDASKCQAGPAVRGRALFNPAGKFNGVTLWSPQNDRADCVVAQVKKLRLKETTYPRVLDFMEAP